MGPGSSSGPRPPDSTGTGSSLLAPRVLSLDPVPRSSPKPVPVHPPRRPVPLVALPPSLRLFLSTTPPSPTSFPSPRPEVLRPPPGPRPFPVPGGCRRRIRSRPRGRFEYGSGDPRLPAGYRVHHRDGAGQGVPIPSLPDSPYWVDGRPGKGCPFGEILGLSPQDFKPIRDWVCGRDPPT